MLVSCACDWGRPSRDWPCAWTPSDYYRFLLSVSRNRFLSTDLQSAFWKRFGKEPSLGFQMDLTNLHALLNDQKAGSRSEWTSHQLAFRLLHTRHQRLTDGLGTASIEARGAPEGEATNNKEQDEDRGQQRGRGPVQRHWRDASHHGKDNKDTGSGDYQKPIQHAARRL